MGQRAQRQAIADRAIAGDEIERSPPRLPVLAAPAPPLRLRLPALDRQHIAGGLGQPASEHTGEAEPLLRVLQFGILRRDVLRQIGFLHDPLGGIFVGRRDIVAVNAEL